MKRKIRISKRKKTAFFSGILSACMLMSALPVNVLAEDAAADMGLTLTESGYLSEQGFDVMLYQTSFDQTFGDQHCAALELILHGNRIATNGDIRLMPTPEQWDAIPVVGETEVDPATNKITAHCSFPDYDMNYTVNVEPEGTGIKVTVNLENPLPEILEGRAGFNLEFLPTTYRGKTYSVDGSEVGVFPMSPKDDMESVPIPEDDPLQEKPYVTEWKEGRGDAQPTAFASGSKITLAPEDEENCVTISSDGNEIFMYDGRNRAQNGWFVARSLIPSGKTDEAIVWHIQPKLQEDWVRGPVIAHSQAGYEPGLSKVAIIEMDKNYETPSEASVVRLNDDGSYETVFTGALTEAPDWTRYHYAKFDFTEVKEPGMYAIEMDGRRSDLFPIKEGVYSKTWQDCLSTFLATAMDHISVREGYRIWKGVAHMDDARQAPPNIEFFDGWSMGESTDSEYEVGEHIDGLNVGGWSDAGDFDIQTSRNQQVIQTLALADQLFSLEYDDLTVDQEARQVEMHRPDGQADIKQQIEHGVLQQLAQIDSVGHFFPVLEVPTLRQYTHLGDGSTDTDGKIYSEELGYNETDGVYSGRPDDRWAFTTKTPNMQFSGAAALAAASKSLKGYNDELAAKCLEYAKNSWAGEEHKAEFDMEDWGDRSLANAEWLAAIELLQATDGEQEYKDRVLELFEIQKDRIGNDGWRAALILDYMDDEFKAAFEEAVKNYMVTFEEEMAKTPFGVPTTQGMWGGTSGVVNQGVRMYVLHKTFPELVSADYTMTVANYILGTHPVSSTSYIAGIGTVSETNVYNFTRADESFIAGSIVPGYVILQPDYPECKSDFNFLWFEKEAVIDTSASWIIVANAANEIAQETSQEAAQ